MCRKLVVNLNICKSYCLGPIARPMLGACSSHSEATACLRSPIIRRPHCAQTSLVYDQHSNKYTGLTIHALSLYLYPRHVPEIVALALHVNLGSIHSARRQIRISVGVLPFCHNFHHNYFCLIFVIFWSQSCFSCDCNSYFPTNFCSTTEVTYWTRYNSFHILAL